MCSAYYNTCNTVIDYTVNVCFGPFYTLQSSFVNIIFDIWFFLNYIWSKNDQQKHSMYNLCLFHISPQRRHQIRFFTIKMYLCMIGPVGHYRHASLTASWCASHMYLGIFWMVCMCVHIYFIHTCVCLLGHTLLCIRSKIMRSAQGIQEKKLSFYEVAITAPPPGRSV